MATTFELWDTESGNLLDTFETEDDALADVYAAIAEHGQQAVATLLLGEDDGHGGSRPVAFGAELSNRAQIWYRQSRREAPVSG